MRVLTLCSHFTYIPQISYILQYQELLVVLQILTLVVRVLGLAPGPAPTRLDQLIAGPLELRGGEGAVHAEAVGGGWWVEVQLVGHAHDDVVGGVLDAVDQATEH